MRHNKRIPLSFYEHELSNNFARYQKTADLQTKLIINNYANDKLQNELTNLKMQNLMLKKKLICKEIYPQNITTNCYGQKTVTKTNDACSNMNMSNKTKNIIQYIDRSKASISDKETADKNKIASVKKYVILDTYKNTPKLIKQTQLENGNSIIQLSKQVYIDPKSNTQHYCSVGHLKQSQSMMIEPIVNKNVKQHQLQSNSSQNKDSKFPSRLNQFQGKKAIGHFQECEGRRCALSQINNFNRWNSESNFGFKSNMVGKLPDCDNKKRKTYLSVVSIASKQLKQPKLQKI